MTKTVTRESGNASLKGSNYDFNVHSLVEIAEILRSIPEYNGNRFYVDTDVGVDSASSNGQYNERFKTIDYAVGRCTANNGDVIIVLPSTTQYDENTQNSGIALDVAGVAIIAPENRLVRVVNSSATADSVMEISADNCLVQGLYFAETTLTVEGIVATGTPLLNIRIRNVTFSGQMENGIRLDGAVLSEVSGCTISGSTNDGIEIEGASSRCTIRDCYIESCLDNGIHINETTATRNLITKNHINGSAGLTDVGIMLTNGTLNQITDNRVTGCTRNWLNTGGISNGFQGNLGESFVTSFEATGALSSTEISVLSPLYDSGHAGTINVSYDVSGFTISQSLTSWLDAFPTTASSNVVTDMSSFIVGIDSIVADLRYSGFRGGKGVMQTRFQYITVPATLTVSVWITEVE